MIEVVRIAEGWTWTMIGVCGRVLAYTAERFPSNHAANDAAKDFRVRCWALGEALDHRQGRSI